MLAFERTTPSSRQKTSGLPPLVLAWQNAASVAVGPQPRKEGSKNPVVTLMLFDDVEVTDSENRVDSGDEVGASRSEDLSDAVFAD